MICHLSIKKSIFIFLLFVFSITKKEIQAQSVQKNSIQWLNPVTDSFSFIDGRAWQHHLASPYDRLPAYAKEKVRPPLWNLSENTAGEYIEFKTAATSIIVRYTVKGNLAMPHMPATGVSGVDLYAKDSHGSWHWARGSYHFGDTIEYKFSNLSLSAAEEEFRLYLPLYNTVTWMNIGVPFETTFRFLPIKKENCIVAYGTSILQGACASRPGLAWTNILGRKLNQTIINLGFSGNGQLEQPIIDLMNETNASLYILDCMPNLTMGYTFTREEVSRRIVSSVKSLQSVHPDVPVLLTGHCGGIPGINVDTSLNHKYYETELLLINTFKRMKSDGFKNIFLLTASEIGFNDELTVDGTHPNDAGMMKYADAYEKVIREILKAKRKK